MTLALQRGGADDYDVMQDAETVGRIYRMKAEGLRYRHGSATIAGHKLSSAGSRWRDNETLS